MATPAFFWQPFTWQMILKPLNFNLKVSLGLISILLPYVLIGAFREYWKKWTYCHCVACRVGVSGGVLWSFLVFTAFRVFLFCFVLFCLFSIQRVPLKVSCRAGLMVTNSLVFVCLRNYLFYFEWKPFWIKNSWLHIFLI